MFLYVTLVLDILVTQVTADKLRKAVVALPIGLHRAYVSPRRASNFTLSDVSFQV